LRISFDSGEHVCTFGLVKEKRYRMENTNLYKDIENISIQYFDYAVDSIMVGLPIVSEDRWPPES